MHRMGIIHCFYTGVRKRCNTRDGNRTSVPWCPATRVVLSSVSLALKRRHIFSRQRALKDSLCLSEELSGHLTPVDWQYISPTKHKLWAPVQGSHVDLAKLQDRGPSGLGDGLSPTPSSLTWVVRWHFTCNSSAEASGARSRRYTVSRVSHPDWASTVLSRGASRRNLSSSLDWAKT